MKNSCFDLYKRNILSQIITSKFINRWNNKTPRLSRMEITAYSKTQQWEIPTIVFSIITARQPLVSQIPKKTLKLQQPRKIVITSGTKRIFKDWGGIGQLLLPFLVEHSISKVLVSPQQTFTWNADQARAGQFFNALIWEYLLPSANIYTADNFKIEIRVTGINTTSNSLIFLAQFLQMPVKLIRP